MRLTVSAAPALFRPLTLQIERIAAGGLHRIEAPDLRVDGPALAALRESQRCTVTLVAKACIDQSSALLEVDRETVDLRFLPPSY